MEDNYASSQESTQQLRDTQDLQDLAVVIEEQEADGRTVWGRLFAIQEPLASYNLTKKIHTFGRGDVDHRFTSTNFDRALLPFISNLHFKIVLDEKQDGEPLVILEDLSLNGMYINGKSTKGTNRCVLQNNCEIGFANPTKKLYVFYDCLKNDAEDYPRELTQVYTISKKLGEGSFGEVRLAYRQGTLERCAIKILRKKGTCMALNNLKQITNEINLLKSVNHPCIIKFLDAVETPEKMFIVMEAAGGGELFDRLVSRSLPEPTVKFFFYQLCLAVQYLHQHRITHRDIKPENILLATTEEFTTIKLTDFGLSKLAADASQMTTFCGTFIYIAPELLDTTIATYTSQVDMWSLGVVLYVSFTATSPFHGTDMEVRQSILQARYSFNNEVWKNVSESARDLIMRLLVRDPALRLDATAALRHSWLQDEDMKRQVEKLLQAPPPTFSPGKKRPLEDEDEDATRLMDKTPKLTNGFKEEVMLGKW